MKEVKGDIWDYYDRGNWIVITTNGTVKKNGECVMGRGVALQAKQRFPELPLKLGQAIKVSGNVPRGFLSLKLLTLPTKHNWWEKSDLVLIEEGCKKLMIDYKVDSLKVVYMVRPGCSNGRLDWKDVKPILEKYLDDRFIIVERREK